MFAWIILDGFHRTHPQHFSAQTICALSDMSNLPFGAINQPIKSSKTIPNQTYQNSWYCNVVPSQVYNPTNTSLQRVKLFLAGWLVHGPKNNSLIVHLSYCCIPVLMPNDHLKLLHQISMFLSPLEKNYHRHIFARGEPSPSEHEGSFKRTMSKPCLAYISNKLSIVSLDCFVYPCLSQLNGSEWNNNGSIHLLWCNNFRV